MFEHHTTYNPVSGYLKSFLVSKEKQTVYIKSLGTAVLFLTDGNPYSWNFQENLIFLQLKDLAFSHGFSIVKHFTDQKNWFTDSLWIKK